MAMFGGSCLLKLLGLLALLLGLELRRVSSVKFGESRMVYEWTSLDFDWPSDEARNESIRNGSFVPERNLLAGIKVYKGEVYLTIPRWRWNSGHPATLVKVVQGSDKAKVKLRPYPDWASQTVGNCEALQYVQSMEIDPNTGLMYVIDAGRTGLAGNEVPMNRCPAKLVIFDLESDAKVDVYEFPASVVSRTRNFMNDIVLDYINGSVAFAYVTDVNEGKIYAVDLRRRSSYAVEDASMKPEVGSSGGTIITVNGFPYTFNAAVDGIAMSYDFRYVYYCPLGGYGLYQIPTLELRRDVSTETLANTSTTSFPDSGGIRHVGRKVSQTDGMAHGKSGLYFGAMGLNALYWWDVANDASEQEVAVGEVKMTSQVRVVGDDDTMQWIDTFAFDGTGWLWFVSNRLHLFVNDMMDFSGDDGVNMRVWKVYVGDGGYLEGAPGRTTAENNVASRPVSVSLVVVVAWGLVTSIFVARWRTL